MRRIRGKHTKPELAVRGMVSKLRFRYTVHASNLPGKPDLVFKSRKKVIFVHGCFWHLHPRATCSDSRIPKTRIDYWSKKLKRNVQRDARNIRRLRRLGWRVLVVWDCQTKSWDDGLEKKLITFLRK